MVYGSGREGGGEALFRRGPEQELFLQGSEEEHEPPPGRILGARSPEPNVVPIRSLPNDVASPVEGSFRVNALVMLRCRVVNEDCLAGGTPVRPGAVVTIDRAAGPLRFSVEEVYPAAAELIDVRVRFATLPNVLDVFRREARSRPKWDITPVFVSFEEPRTISVTSRGESVETTEQLSVVRAVLRVPAQRSAAGWKYRGGPLRVGEGFTFEMSQQLMSGTIVDIRAPEVSRNP